ncbi:MAG TPA: lysylphosphatidylglycerol synthase transmembrane domain-containing protein [Kofleriaceae bacterium]|nr:lysylphosphatidylglycerol synthase transmembrane domain-containing protein [Kofleriaceae bacterium]
MKQRLGLVVRVLGTVAALAWIVTRVDVLAARDALARIPLRTFAIAVGLVAANVVAGATRWRVLLGAYGATRIARLATLVRLYVIAFFYNTYLPGAVAGDVGRGVVTRHAFDEEGATGALAVVLVERALGLFGLFALLAVGLVATPGAIDRGALWWWTVLGSLGSFALVAAIPLARTLGPRLPARLARLATLAGKLPALHDRRGFAAAIALSIATQALVAIAGWVVLAELAPIDLTASLLVIPLAAATTFLPITVGGAGAREAVYVTLCASLFGMPQADALAASLGLWLAHLIVGAAGGLAQLSRNPDIT